MEKVTAGRDYLGAFAPQFAALNDDVLFDQVWSREDVLPAKLRSMITIAALMGAGITDQSLTSHLQKGKDNGIKKSELVELVTQLAFYTGWPKAWSVFAQAMEVYGDQEEPVAELAYPGEAIEDEACFNGKVYVQHIWSFDKPALADVVTFPAGVHNHWHSHSTGQTLLVTAGKGWYQEAGKPAQALKVGELVHIPAETKHWHGASKDSDFSHLALEDYSKGAPTWFEALSDDDYQALG